VSPGTRENDQAKANFAGYNNVDADAPDADGHQPLRCGPGGCRAVFDTIFSV
jgi:hypothetical protein